jgi:hypothetical protein
MYEIIRVEDVSRPRCKRFVGHIKVNVTGKDTIKTAILEATVNIRHSSKYNSESTKIRFEGIPAHVVRLYVYSESKLICQSMWVGKDFKDAPLPMPLKYNDSIGDIGIVW